jgi:hypothetical protein
MELSGSGKMYGGATPAERGLAASVREMHPIDGNIQNAKKSNAVGNFTLLLNQVIHSKDANPAPSQYMKLINYVIRENKFKNYGRLDKPTDALVEDHNSTDARVRASLPRLTLIANSKKPPKEAIPMPVVAPSKRSLNPPSPPPVPAPAPVEVPPEPERPSTPPPQEREEDYSAPTPKRSRTGESIPQHMRRGDYFSEGLNR